MASKKLVGMRYVLYGRCSSDDQKNKDFSTLDVQEGLNRHYVKEKGGTVAGAYKDEAVSGTTLKRKGWLQLLSDAQAGKFDAVIVTYMSRLGRGRAFVIAEYELEKCGVRVEMVKEQFSDDMSGYLGKNMTTMMDGSYAFQVRQWTMTKMQAMVEAGFFPGGYPPFGMQKVVATEAIYFHKPGNEPPKRLVPDADTAPIVRQAFAFFLEGQSLASVRAYLSSVTTRDWNTTRVKALLMNETYKGTLAFGQWRNEAAWEPVVSPETWKAAQDALTGRAVRPPRPEADEFTYYLRGRVHCPHCGCPYTQSSHWGRGGIRAHYYVCQTTNRQKREGGVKCPVGRVNAGKLHRSVLGFIQRGAAHKTFLHQVIRQSGGWGEAEEVQKSVRGQLGKQKQSVEMRIANYVKAIGDGRDSPALMAALDRAEADRETVVQEIEAADRGIAAATVRRPTAERLSLAWGRSMEVWKVLTEEERTELLGSLVQAVEMTDKKSMALELLPVVSATLSEVRATPSFKSGGRT